MAADKIPFKQDDISVMPIIGKSIVALLFLGGVAYSGLWLAKKYIPGFGQAYLSQKNGRIRIVEQARINAGLRIYIIEIDGNSLVVAQGENVVLLNSPIKTARMDDE